MLLLFPGLLLLAIAAALGTVPLFLRRFRSLWLVALGASLVAWLVVLIWHFELPLSTGLPGWGSTFALPTGMQFSVDDLTWLPAWSLMCLLLAGLIAAAAQPQGQPSLSWALPPAFAGMALLALSASDAITLVVAWSALDLAEVGLIIAGQRGGASTQPAVAAFAIRISASALAVLAQALAAGNKDPTGFALLMIVAIIVRILAQTLLSTARASSGLAGGVGTTVRLASAIATIGFLPRLAVGAGGSSLGTLLAVCVAAIGLAAGWVWLRTVEPVSGLACAIAGLSSLAVGSALLGNPPGAAAWVAALALAGGALFLSPGRSPWFSPALLLAAWGLSALPFSLTGAGWPSELRVQQWPFVFFLLAQAVLIAGFLRQAFPPRTAPPRENGTASLQGVLDFSIAFLLGLQVLLGLWGWQGAGQSQSLVFGGAGTALGLAFFGSRSWLHLDLGSLSRNMQAAAQRVGALVRGLLSGVWAASGQLVRGITSLLEGQAGIMWGLLLLALFVSLIVGGSQ